MNHIKYQIEIPSKGLLKKIDEVYQRKNISELQMLIQKMEEKLGSNLTKRKQILLHYSLNCAYHFQSQLSKSDINFAKAMNSVREAIKILETMKLQELNRETQYMLCHIYRIYANILDDCGRSNLAFEYYLKIMDIDKQYAWAKCDLALCFCQYSWTMTVTPGIIEILKYVACQLFQDAFLISGNKALKDEHKKTFEEAFQKFISEKIRIQSKEEFDKGLINELISTGYIECKTQEEVVYRQWVHKNTLFLHPLNELKQFSNFFDYDLLHFKSMVKEDHLTQSYLEMYNEIKETFIYARYVLYDALTDNSSKPTFIDTNTFIFSENRNIKYSIKCEKLKNVMRLSYSCYDKIAFFINAYFNLGIDVNRVSMTKIWNSSKLKTNPIDSLSRLHGPSDNRGLNGLYWNCRDINFSRNDINEPPVQLEIEETSLMRNCLEHRHVCITNEILDDTANSLVYNLTETELIEKSLRIMKCLREALICLCSAVNIEEDRRQDKYDSPEIINVRVYDDCWKL